MKTAESYSNGDMVQYQSMQWRLTCGPSPCVKIICTLTKRSQQTAAKLRKETILWSFCSITVDSAAADAEWCQIWPAWERVTCFTLVSPITDNWYNYSSFTSTHCKLRIINNKINNNTTNIYFLSKCQWFMVNDTAYSNIFHVPHKN